MSTERQRDQGEVSTSDAQVLLNKIIPILNSLTCIPGKKGILHSWGYAKKKKQKQKKKRISEKQEQRPPENIDAFICNKTLGFLSIESS